VLSTGMADVHTPQEHIAIADLVYATRLLAEIVKNSEYLIPNT
jgi:di/tripeptidase